MTAHAYSFEFRGILLAGLLGLSATSERSQAEPMYLVRPDPVLLSESQLDSVTAGTTVVSADAFGFALNGPLVRTHTRTHMMSLGRLGDRGIGTAVAIACCGPDVHADVSLGANSDNDLVSVMGSIYRRNSGRYAIAIGWIRILATNGLTPLMFRTFPAASFITPP